MSKVNTFMIISRQQINDKLTNKNLAIYYGIWPINYLSKIFEIARSLGFLS